MSPIVSTAERVRTSLMKVGSYSPKSAGMSAAACILPGMDTPAAAAQRRVEVTLAGRPMCERVLTASQAEGRPCAGCGAPGDELIPVGVVFPSARARKRRGTSMLQLRAQDARRLRAKSRAGAAPEGLFDILMKAYAGRRG